MGGHGKKRERKPGAKKRRRPSERPTFNDFIALRK
jgi:hypothetical protein